MIKKACRKCLTAKILSAFPFRNKLKGIKHSTCKDCLNKVSNKRYKAKGEALKKQIKDKQYRNYRENLEICKMNPHMLLCEICGCKDIQLLVFNRGGIKYRSILAFLRSGVLWNVVEDQITDSEIMCINCLFLIKNSL